MPLLAKAVHAKARDTLHLVREVEFLEALEALLLRLGHLGGHQLDGVLVCERRVILAREVAVDAEHGRLSHPHVQVRGLQCRHLTQEIVENVVRHVVSPVCRGAMRRVRCRAWAR